MKRHLIVLLFTVSLHTNAQDLRSKKLDSLFSSLYTKGMFNGNILVADKGNIIFKKSFGIADINGNKPLNTASVFELASVSKQFTSTAILQLVEKRKLKLTDTLRHFFPQLPYHNITIQQLLNHTGGEPDYFDIIEKHWDKSKIIDNKALIDLMAKYLPPIDFKPGEKWAYSNTGYMLLSAIITKVSGLSYGDYLDKNIFKPLGMKNSLVYTRRYQPKKIDNYAFGYVYNDSLQKWCLPDSLAETKFVYYTDGITGDGCVNSTINDLFIWDRALYTNKMIKQETLQQAFQPTPVNGSVENYGFGWGIYENKVYGKVVNHSGGWPGYMTWIFRYIDKDKTIIILTNKMIPLKGLTNAVEHILFNEPYNYPEKR